MRAFSYWLCYTLVAIPSVMGHFIWSMYLLHVPPAAIPGIRLPSFLSSFASLVPTKLADRLPSFILIALGLVMLLLVIRRAWLFVARHERVPSTFTGIPKVLAQVSMWSFLAFLAALVLTVVLQAGSGVPAFLTLVPATVCVPWAFFLTETKSLFATTRRAG